MTVVPWSGLAPGLRATDPGEALTRPDGGLALVRDGAVAASLALWWQEPVGAPYRVGRIGHTTWTDPEDGAALLAAAVGRLRQRGMDRAVGPLDGSTWFGYRVVTESGGRPAFAMEPMPEPVIALAFERAGFQPCARYLSSVVQALPDDSAQAAADLARLADAGVTVRPLEPSRARVELTALHSLLLRAFADNPYYAPLSLDRFLALYHPLVARVDPDLVLIAESAADDPGADGDRQRGAAGQPVGVVLAMPDLAQAGRQEAVDTVIIKTLAVDPAQRGKGIGGALVRVVQERARESGYRSAIHALMHDENASTAISAHLGTPFRRYALLGRDLT